MEVLAFFLLVIVLLVVAVAALFVFGVAGRLRRKKLDPERDKLVDPDGGSSERDRPEHVRAENEQQSHFLTQR